MNRPDLSKPVFKILPAAAEAIKKDICPVCGRPIGQFRDELSKREYRISGLCQACQDEVFGGDEE